MTNPVSAASGRKIESNPVSASARLSLRNSRRVRGRLHRVAAELSPLEPRRLFVVTVANPIADIAAQPGSAPQTITLAGPSAVFNTTNLNGVTGTIVTMPVSFGLGTNAVAGAINLRLFDTQTPLSVQNFVNYVNSGSYTNSIVHRTQVAATDGIGIVQGGGFTYANGQFGSVSTVAPVVNEFSSSPRDSQNRVNTRGTIAYAKTSDPNSATSQWFINTTDNTALDNTANSGGFTTFGQVIGGLNIADRINQLTTYNGTSVNAAFGTLPLADYAGAALVDANVVRFSGASVVSNPTTFFNYTVSSSNSNLVTATITPQNTLQLSFSPNASGSATVTLTGTDLTGASVSDTFNVSLAAPIAAVRINNQVVNSGATVAYGEVFTGQQVTQTFTIRNTGSQPLTFGTPTLSSGDFSVVTAPSATVAPNGTTTLVVSINTAATGARSATLTLPTNAANATGGNLTYNLTGTVGSGLTLGTGGVRSVTFTTGDGTVATFSYRGAGSAVFGFNGNGLSVSTVRGAARVSGSNVSVTDITFSGNTASSSGLSLSTSRGSRTVNIATLTAPGALGTLSLGRAVITDALTLGSTASSVSLLGVDSASVAFTGAVRTFSTLNFATSSLTGSAGVPSLSLGNVSASVVNVGGNATSVKLSSLAGSTLGYAGSVASLTVAGGVTDSSITTGPLGRFSAGQVVRSTVSAPSVRTFAISSRLADAFAGSTLSAGNTGSIAVGALSPAGSQLQINASAISSLTGRVVNGRTFSFRRITPANEAAVASSLNTLGLSSERITLDLAS